MQEAGYSGNSSEDIAPPSSTSVDAAKKDAVELLFVRVNSAGTPLEGEELTYSLLKAAWPDAAKFIDSLDHKPAQASRIAMLCTRLILARRQAPINQDKKPAMPTSPGVNEFRRLVRDQNPAHPGFFSDLQQFIQNDANGLFNQAWQFLTEKPYALLPVLAVELAHKSPDVYFLLLRWLDRLQAAGIKINQLEEGIHRRTLGFLTALAWFARDKPRACAAIWPDLQSEVDLKKLTDRFNRTRFKLACRLDARFNIRMVPLPSADQLELACRRGVTGHQNCANTITKVDSAIWREWSWASFADLLVKDNESKQQWNEHLKPDMPESDDIPDLSESVLQSARYFADSLWGARQILLYAQRESLKQWYPNFDPSLPEYMEDKNRPWDYDHILPQNLLRTDSGNSIRNIPSVIWDWCGSIGNLRAWPLEANRSDGDGSPCLKLEDVSEEERRYGITDGPTERKASFVKEDLDWPCWQGCVPMTNQGHVEDRRYLALSDYHDYRRALINAIVLRFAALYRNWYDEMRIIDLH